MYDFESMSRSEKRSLLERLEYDLSRGDVDFSSNDMLVWEAACAAASSKQNIRSVIPKYISERKYKAAVEFTMEYMAKGCGRRLNRQERVLLLDTIFEALATHMRNWGPATTAKTMIDNYEAIPEAMDNEFPGYADSELLGWLIRPK